MWIRTVIFSSVAVILEARFFVFAPAMLRILMSHQLLTRTFQSTLAAACFLAQPINPGGLAGQIFLAIDRSGTATNNNIYMLATVQQFSASNGSDIMFSRSTDGGVTFSVAATDYGRSG